MPSSPGWHRRERRRRSKARERIQRATTSGTAYPTIWKDLALLEHHHSRPVYSKARRILRLHRGMSGWLSSRQWRGGRGSGSYGYSAGGYYQSKGTGKGEFADNERNSRRERQKEKKQMANQSKGSGKADGASEPMDKEKAVETGPSYAEMLKQSKLPEAKKQQAADAIEEILAGAGEDRLQLLGHLRALVPETGVASSSSGNEVSLKTRIHRVGNALGKASSKVAKHTEEIVLKQKTWEKCSRAIREWAASQRKAYEKDLEESKEALAVAQKEEKEAMVQLKDLQAQLEAQGPQVAEGAQPIEVEDEGLFDTPPSMQEKDSGMTPMMKKLSLELQEAKVEKEELKRQNMLMMEETQRLFMQMKQNSGSDPVVPKMNQPEGRGDAGRGGSKEARAGSTEASKAIRKGQIYSGTGAGGRTCCGGCDETRQGKVTEEGRLAKLLAFSQFVDVNDMAISNMTVSGCPTDGFFRCVAQVLCDVDGFRVRDWYWSPWIAINLMDCVELACDKGDSNTECGFLPDTWMPDTQDNDDMAFMQIGMATDSQRLVPIRIVTFDGQAATVSVDLDQDLLRQVALDWPFDEQSRDEVIAYHRVSNPPALPMVDDRTHVEMYIAELGSDRFSQVHEDDVLILATIVWTGPSEWVHRKQRVMRGDLLEPTGCSYSCIFAFIGFANVLRSCACCITMGYRLAIWNLNPEGSQLAITSFFVFALTRKLV